MNYTGQTSFAEMFEYYCTRNVTSAREYEEREMMRWAKDRIQQAPREGWEQAKREAAGIIDDTEEVESMSVYAQLGDAHRTKMSIADAIAAMEYGGEG